MKPRILCEAGKEPSLGDVTLAIMTARGWGTRAWLTAALGALVDGDGLSRLLARLQELGHVEVSIDGLRWKVRSPVWVPDRSSVAGKRQIEFAVGARDRLFWDDNSSALRINPGDVSQPAKTVRVASGGCDLATHLRGKLPNLAEWTQRQHSYNAAEMEQRIGRLSSTGHVEDVFPSRGQVGSWHDSHGRRYAVNLGGILYDIPFGTARIWATSWMPVARRGSRLAIPRMYQPPLPFRRYLVLCSGLLPVEETDAYGNSWLVYSGVDELVFDAISSKLPMCEIKCTI